MKRERKPGDDVVSNAYRIAIEGRDEGVIEGFASCIGLLLEAGRVASARACYCELLRRMPLAAGHTRIHALERAIAEHPNPNAKPKKRKP